MVDRGPGDRSQDAIRDVARTGDLQEMAAAPRGHALLRWEVVRLVSGFCILNAFLLGVKAFSGRADHASRRLLLETLNSEG